METSAMTAKLVVSYNLDPMDVARIRKQFVVQTNYTVAQMDTNVMCHRVYVSEKQYTMHFI
ncbi:hypothetical protein B4U79_14439 [Dinothrombium tinctorium]|uniref:Uncharacterized protein n=1 Tax=Dinothrombium tinctorium TaxID=1965070 RepID=A0A3S4QVJ1_9ACAR|nr:hypothetical protein B4U79_14439 [Dinothrombium tinctorium]